MNLLLHKIIDGNHLKVLETRAEEICPEICINLRYQILHAAQINILRISPLGDFKMYRLVWLYDKRVLFEVFRSQYAC